MIKLPDSVPASGVSSTQHYPGFIILYYGDYFRRRLITVLTSIRLLWTLSLRRWHAG
ncbi:hypothetical protein KCP74_19635 [Salmonella enterica subsp. enterica]|nr:hypothetical protein KCP74_19635 [Salmonella enterica subsp. enterica]